MRKNIGLSGIIRARIKRFRTRSGATLAELMVAVAIFSIAILGFINAFRYITQALRVTRARTLASNLAQERVEVLKNYSYYALLITTAPSVDNSISPAVTYDSVNYSAETITIGGIVFTRYSFVALAQVDNNVISTVTYTYPDTGLKEIQVHVLWSENGVRKKMSLSNLLENPNVNALDSTITGTVNKATGGGLASAIVKTAENADWNATTDTSGNYSFRVYHGSYTIVASSAGYFSATSSLINVSTASTTTAPTLTLTAIASGTVQGYAWMNTGLVISQVVTSTQQADNNNFVAQYIELFNPTTYTITIGGATPAIKVNFQAPAADSDSDTCADATYGIKLTYVNTFVPAGKYYLVADTSTFVVNGAKRYADAYYADTADTYCSAAPDNNIWKLVGSPPLKKMIMPPGDGGSVWLTNAAGTVIDAVGWSHGGNLPVRYEGTYISDTGSGLADGNQIVRISSPAASLANAGMSSYGRAYDSDKNNLDFVYPPVISGIVANPRYSQDTTTMTVISGKPAIGAYVSSSDSYSGSTIAYRTSIASGTNNLPVAFYSLGGVSTGSWTLDISSSGYTVQIPTVTYAQNTITWMPTATSTPSWNLANNYGVNLTSSSYGGFLTGTVTDIFGNNISGITMTAGGTTKTTGTNGKYFASVSSGPITAVFNPANANPNYITATYELTITQGQALTQDVTLSPGGTLYGYVTSGTTPQPNIPVTANVGGSQYAGATSNTSGYFYMRNITTGTYTVFPVIDVGQDSSPNSVSVTLNAGQTVFVGSFTVVGALSTLTGSVTYSGSALTSGALVVASTGSLASTPISVVASSASAQTVRYMVSTQADGTYTLPLRGANTYYVSIYVPVVNSSAGTVSTTTKTYTNVFVPVNSTKTQNLAVP
jgi:hypothetical protein